MSEYINNEFLANLRKHGKAKLANKIEIEYHSKLQKAREYLKNEKRECNKQDILKSLGIE